MGGRQMISHQNWGSVNEIDYFLGGWGICYHLNGGWSHTYGLNTGRMVDQMSILKQWKK